MSQIHYREAVLPSGVTVKYAESGPATAPVLLLLHGFPSSHHQFRNLIPRLADKYHVIAPDLPGFGTTTVPAGVRVTFDMMAETIGALVDYLGIQVFAAYVLDYGAPTLFRLALKRPELVKAIITQNGNAYESGLGADFWAPLRLWWEGGRARLDS